MVKGGGVVENTN